MTKRGMETIHIIVALVVALVAAVLLIAALTGKFQTAAKFGSCSGQQGTCIKADAACPEAKPAVVYTNDCSDANKCCIAGG